LCLQHDLSPPDHLGVSIPKAILIYSSVTLLLGTR
jgi:hypothetical protein